MMVSKSRGKRVSNTSSTIKQNEWVPHLNPYNTPWYSWNLHKSNNKTNTVENLNYKSTKIKTPQENSGGFAKDVRDYLLTSTLHGLRYIGEKNLTWLERFFWLTAFLCSLICAGFFILNVYAKWRMSPMIVSINPEDMPLKKLPFPALTICNVNQAKKSVAERYTASGTSVEKKLLESLCSTQTDADLFEDTLAESADWDHTRSFLINVTQPCEEMLAICIWSSKTMSCQDLFNAQLTDEGLCCTFNVVHRDMMFRNPRDLNDMNITFPSPAVDWTPENGYPDDAPPDGFPWKPKGSATHLQALWCCGCLWAAVITYHHVSHLPVCPLFYKNKTKLSSRSPQEEQEAMDDGPIHIVIALQGIGTDHGLTLILDANVPEYYCASTKSVGFKILLHNPTETPKIAKLGEIYGPGIEARVAVKPRILDAQPALKDIDVSKRYCLFSSELNLVFYRTYTFKNCQMECEARRMLQICKCVLYYMPKNKTTRICGKGDAKCYNNLWKYLPKGDDQSCDECLPACTEISYFERLSTAPLNKNLIINYAQSLQLSHNITSEYFTANMLVIHFYFEDKSFLRFTKGEIFGLTEFLSNTGGLLGLCMGFSMMSAVELLYYITLRAMCVARRRRRVQPFVK